MEDGNVLAQEGLETGVHPPLAELGRQVPFHPGKQSIFVCHANENHIFVSYGDSNYYAFALHYTPLGLYRCVVFVGGYDTTELYSSVGFTIQ